jgi:ABC-type nitrate/sulfonate/bicarbonate transport system permease component
MSIIRRGIFLVAVPLVLVVLWWLATQHDTSFYWPSPHRVSDTFVQTWTPAEIRHDLLPSVVRFVLGFLLATVVGIGLGVTIGCYRGSREAMEPVLEFLRAVPPPAMIPVIILIAGIGHGMKVLVIFLGCIWPVLLNTVEGVRAIDPVLRDSARSYGFGPYCRLRRLILPAASPRILAGARQSMSLGIILMVISEMFAASNEIGFTIIQFQRTFAIPEMWGGIILLGLVGLVSAALFHLAETHILRLVPRLPGFPTKA